MKTRTCLLLVVSCIYCVNASYKGKYSIFILKIYFWKALLIFHRIFKDEVIHSFQYTIFPQRIITRRNGWSVNHTLDCILIQGHQRQPLLTLGPLHWGLVCPFLALCQWQAIHYNDTFYRPWPIQSGMIWRQRYQTTLQIQRKWQLHWCPKIILFWWIRWCPLPWAL